MGVLVVAKVDKETIEKIRTSLDIVEVVGEYVQLKKQGRNYSGLCPFHNERTPSFSVSPDKQIFYCFGCGVGGDLFTFIEEIEGFNFPETLQHLGERAGVDLPQQNQRDNRKDDRSKALYHGMELLTKFYHFLLTDPRYGSVAKRYLTERGFTDKTIQTFNIGYAVDAWDTATKFLKKRNIPTEMFESIGMLSKREFDGKSFDRFRHRVMFPIQDQKGQTVAFGGRVLGDQKPKYLNSPESNIFHKGRILYGYHLARPAIKQANEVILFEGYVDVIKAHQAGLINCVASMGTSLTDDQAGLLTRNAEKIIICYDSDQAGTKAAFRAAELLKSYGRTIKIATMPDGMDPDDYIDRNGGDRFRNEVIGASLTVMAFKMQYFRHGKNLNDEGDRLRYIEEILHEISELTKAVERDHYLRQLSDEFSISLDALKQQQYQAYRRARQKHPLPNGEPKSRLIPKSRTLFPAYQMAERRLIAHMMRDADIAEQVREDIGGAFNIDIHQALAAHLYAYYAEGKSPEFANFIQNLGDSDLKSSATEIAMMSVNESVTQQEVEDYIHRIIRHGKEIEIQEKVEEKKKAEQNNDVETATRMLAEIIAMTKELERR